MLIYYFWIIFMAFVQAVTVGFWWPVLVVIWAAGRKPAERVYPLAFVGGVVADLLTGRTLGSSALWLLAVVAAIYLVRERFRFRLRWLAVYVVIIEGLCHFLVF